MATFVKRLTGADLDTARRWNVGGTDLGIPYVLENGSIGYLFGDTFSGPWPGGPDWRAPVMLRSNVDPQSNDIVFDSAARVLGDGFAPAIMHNEQDANSEHAFGSEFSVIPNDGIGFPENRGQIVSYQSIWKWSGPNGSSWSTNYSGLAYSNNGNDFTRSELKWPNNPNNDDPFQMWSMQRDPDGYIYIFSVRAGRQKGPMMLQRVHWDHMMDIQYYQGWGWNGCDWGWGRPCTGILCGVFGEPSVKRLRDGIWVMSYLDVTQPGGGSIVTRTAARPDAPWSFPKTQVTWAQQPVLYGGFIHPRSTAAPDDLHLMVSRWIKDTHGNTTAYDVSHWRGSA
ncbi:MAG: DUF4185 domain-containing protein [Caldilineaceae bacterium]